MDKVTITIKPKTYTREELTTTHKDMILAKNELLIETDGENESLVLRFKKGDGISIYSQLPYISTLYDLSPNFSLINADNTKEINIVLKES